MSDLKPCPFCGDEGPFIFNAGGGYIECEKCGGGVSYHGDDLDRLTLKWNARPIEGALKAEVEQLRALIQRFIDDESGWGTEEVTSRECEEHDKLVAEARALLEKKG